MTPGQDCMQCHTANGLASARVWTVAGTVYADPLAEPDGGLLNAQILVMDHVGTQLTLLSNEAGNFYTAEPLVPPIQVEAQWGDHRMRMVEPPTAVQPCATCPPAVSFSCNACHTVPPGLLDGGLPLLAPGRVFVPATATP